MTFGRRLVLPLVGLLLLVQAAAGVALYHATRAVVVTDAEAQLVDTIDQAMHLLGPTRNLSAGLPRGAGLLIANNASGWTVAGGDISQALAVSLPLPGLAFPDQPQSIESGGEELLFHAALLPGSPDQPLAAVVAARSLTDGLQHYRSVWLVLAGGLCALLGGALLTAWLIDRGVARPIGDLATQIARIGQGDYAAPRTSPRDEFGQRLSVALTNMTQAIADREYRIREMVLHEPVTHLPNRAAFLEAIAPQLGAERAAVLVIGLVHAQEIANTVNRDVTDRVLRNTATRLGRLLGDMPLACLSDRTFAAFLRNVGELRARSIAARIVSQFETPFIDGKLTIDTVAAVGIALMPAHGDDGPLLLRRAEVALQAGVRAEHRWAVYDHATDPHRPERLSLMSDLRQGLGRGEFMLVYQPKLHLASGQITGAEALIRWHHPQRGLVPTGEFIQLAEDTGNIAHLTRWALRTGVEQAAKWHAAGLELQVSINISARDLSDARLPNRVAQLIEGHRLGPETLALEVTESTIMTNPTAAIAVLRRLAEQNIAVSVDDFGVGRASLAYLRTLPVRELKIDKTFIRRVVDDDEDRKIVRSVVELGHSLGFAVSVEGVEDAATLAIVSQLGCDYVQGYYIARPLVPEMLVRFVRQPPPFVHA